MGNSNGKPIVLTDEGKLRIFDDVGTTYYEHKLTFCSGLVNLGHFRLLRVVSMVYNKNTVVSITVSKLTSTVPTTGRQRSLRQGQNCGTKGHRLDVRAQVYQKG